MRLVDMENELKALIEKDVKNPDIYNKIYKLSEYYINWRKLLNNNSDVEGVATIMAEDLYMKIYRGGTIESWIGYMRLYCKAAIRMYRKMTSSEIIDTTTDPNLAEGIVLMSTSYPESFEDDIITNKLYFDNIPNIIDNFMENISRYPKYTKEYMNSKLSILLSINAKKFISYNLDDSSLAYTRLLYNIVLNKLLNNFKDNNVKRASNSFSLMQLYTMGNADID